MSDITLRIDGRIYGGWKDIRVVRSIEQSADTFELALTDRWGDERLPVPIRAGTPGELWLGDARIVTGYVDDALPEYDDQTHTVRVEGRSKAGDLVDCSLAPEKGKPLQWSGRSLLQIAKDLAGRFGIEVSAEVDVGEAFTRVAMEPGQTVWEFLERLARIRGVRIVSRPDGGLLITRAGTARYQTALVLGQNILRASGQFSSREQFSDYIVQGQVTGGSKTWDGAIAEAAAHVRSQVINAHVGRYRPTVIVQDETDGIADAKRRAEWQRNVAWGRGQGVVYTVSGWTAGTEGLWHPNRLVRVDDAFMGIQGDRLIMSVQFLLDGRGQRTELRVMPREAAELIPLPEADASSESAPVWGVRNPEQDGTS